MPVPTETFWNMKVLNRVFVAAALLLLLGTIGLVMVDYNREWRQYQRQAVTWRVAMTEDAVRAARTADIELRRAELEAERARLQAELPHDQIARLRSEQAEAQRRKKQLELPTATVRGEIGPLQQQIERAVLEHGEGSPQVTRLRSRLASVEADYHTRQSQLDAAEAVLERTRAELDRHFAHVAELEREIGDIDRQQQTLTEQLAELAPSGAARLGKIIRDAPLLDWFNPTEKVQQVVTPEIRTDLNFITVDTIDRCNSCHINIDDPAFEETNLLMFAERQLAQAQGQDVNHINHPVVLREFWEDAALAAGLGPQVEQARAEALRAINALRGGEGMPSITPETLAAEFSRVQGVRGSEAQQWHRPLGYYLTDLKQMLREHLGRDEFRKLQSLYRHDLVAAYNAARKEQKLPELSASPVLLGHPRMDLYVEVESAHPMQTMGCTSCHEGSGQETQFEHTAHTPRQMWVDADSGAPVPAFLVRERGDLRDIERLIRDSQRADVSPVTPAPAQPPQEMPAAAQRLVSADAGHGAIALATTGDASAAAAHPGRDGHGLSYHYDLNLADPHNAAPFAPVDEPAGAAVYHRPAAPAGLRRAVRQETYWKKRFGWHHIHFMHWEKPMHALEYIESSCIKCHEQVYDIAEEAPRLFEGRALFASQGCVNCHAVESLEEDLDIRQVGPSLVHVQHKLSSEMIASWVWSPRGFRPMAQMPHYFMLENNSSPVDILRTRTEVAAMTHYLVQTEAKGDRYPYNPQTPPPMPEDKQTHAVDRGRILFNNLGCLACHTNMDEHGEQWIVDDLMRRQGMQEAEARDYFRNMGEGSPDQGYNAQQWYAMQHLRDKLTFVGPELSGVGTKLLAGRSPEEAQAWLYDWLREPRHYSDHTIMPSFRLSEQEALDLTAYLLSLKRPGYEAQDFSVDERGWQLMDNLIGQLRAEHDVNDRIARHVGDRTVSDDEQRQIEREARLYVLGQRMIAHYGCNGCHTISGFEDAASACVNLDEWGLKDPHMLDFGYFDHAFDRKREKPIEIWRVQHEGLTADAPRISADSGHSQRVQVAWEHMHHLEGRSWLYHKLHNTRVYDRGRTQLDGDWSVADDGRMQRLDPGRPYEKLKMPKFFLTDEQVQSLVTFVTGVRKPLVRDTIKATRNPERVKLARGRQLATVLNCIGCHNVHGNDVHLQQFYDVLNDDGSFNYERLNQAPPRLLGQGSKTQPDWLAHFLGNVHTLRPWLKVRMPSYHWDHEHLAAVNDLFASESLMKSADLRAIIEPIQRFIESQPEASWYEASASRYASIAGPVRRLREMGLMLDLVRAQQLDERYTDANERATHWNRLLRQLTFHADLNDIPYPFANTPRPNPDPEQFARGEALFNELRCYQCHALGDEPTLQRLWELEHPGAVPAVPGAPAEDDDPYGDDPYGDPAPAATTPPVAADDDDPYGDPYAEAAPAQRGPRVDDVLPPKLIGGRLYSAPNLSYSASRLRWDWFYRWMSEPATMQPGTAMPQWFPGPVTAPDQPHPLSAFHNYPAAVKDRVESLYGYSGDEQIRLLMEFVYAAGLRNYTPGAEKLYGVEQPAIELTPLERPREAAQPDVDTDAQADPTTPTPAPEPEPEVRRPMVDPNVSTIELHEEPSQTYEGTRIVGLARYEGSMVRRRPLNMMQDPYCAQQHADAPAFTDQLVINEDRTLRNAFIYVKSGLPANESFPIPEHLQQPELDQLDCVYLPHVLGMVAGQTLLIHNSDNTLHNVRMDSRLNGSMNEGMPVKDMVLRRPFNRPEMGIGFKCDVHPWMGAVVHVMEHPFFAVSDVAGRFEITGLPPGTYTLEAIHEDPRIGPVTFQVTVEANASTRADATLVRQ